MIDKSVGHGDTDDGAPLVTTNTVLGEVSGNVAQARNVESIHVTVRPPRLVVPHLLPAVPRNWPRPERADLDAVTARVDQGCRIIVLGGPSGVGKTALALTWAHQHLDRAPDGQFAANAGMDPITKQGVAPNDILRDWLPWLGQHELPASLRTRAALWRTCVGDRRVLLLVDDVRYAQLVRWLLPGGANWLVLVTTQRPLLSLVVHGAGLVLVGRTKKTDDPVWR